MLSRLVIRKALPKAAALRPTAAAFHSSPLRSEEEAKAVAASHPGFLNQFGLDDWKISMPILAALSIPAISNNVRLVCLVPDECCGCSRPALYLSLCSSTC